MNFDVMSNLQALDIFPKNIFLFKNKIINLAGYPTSCKRKVLFGLWYNNYSLQLRHYSPTIDVNVVMLSYFQYKKNVENCNRFKN